MSGKSMKVKLGKPRVALLWFIPAESIFADLDAEITPESADEAAAVQAFRDAMAADPGDESTAESAEDAAAVQVFRDAMAADPGDESTAESAEDAAVAQAIKEETGFDLSKAVSLLQEAADLYARDPEAMEPLIQGIVQGNDVAAQWLRDFLRSVHPENDNGHDDDDEDGDDDEGEAQIIDFERPDGRADDDGEDDEGDES